MKVNIEKFITWLKQPSTIKAIILFLGLVGVTIDPEHMKEYIEGGIVLYMGVAAFIDKG